MLHAPEGAVTKVAFVWRALASSSVPAVLEWTPRNGELIAIAALDRHLVFVSALALLLVLLLLLALLAHIFLDQVFKRGRNMPDIIVNMFVKRQIGGLLSGVLNGPNAMTNARC